jgi:hypothetical protein
MLVLVVDLFFLSPFTPLGGFGTWLLHCLSIDLVVLVLSMYNGLVLQFLWGLVG